MNSRVTVFPSDITSREEAQSLDLNLLRTASSTPTFACLPPYRAASSSFGRDGAHSSEMRASLVGILAVVALASAAPAGPTPLTSAAGNKQTAVMRKPVLSRKANEQPSRDARQGRRRPGQPYYTGHRSVAFLTMGQIDVMQPFPDATGSASPLDPCSGCCSPNGDSSPAAGGRIDQGAPSGQVVSPTHMSMKGESGLGVMDADGLESMANSTNDRCLGCCDVADEMFTLSHDGTRTEGGAGDPSTAMAPKETGSVGSRTTTRKNPSQRPREKITRWGSSAVSSSEEGGIGGLILRRGSQTPAAGRIKVAEGVHPNNYPSQLRKKMSPCLHGGYQSVADSSSMSSSEEAWAAEHIHTWEAKPSSPRRG